MNKSEIHDMILPEKTYAEAMDTVVRPYLARSEERRVGKEC